MRILLAPMQGLVDPLMRDVLTRMGGIDLCVTEFVRVTQTLLPAKTFYRLCPELHTGGRTAAGVPVSVQLLGSDAACLADNAARAAALGAPCIDLNFGCPAPTVNRHCGGAVLLKTPDRLFEIVQAVRAAVPVAIPVTAKMRLGYDDTHQALACAQALATGGAAELVVHARTKVEGYRPPVHWDWLARIREAVNIPVVANGEVWTLADAHACLAESGCSDLMLGRGLVARPDLARQIACHARGEAYAPLDWMGLQAVVQGFFAQAQGMGNPHYPVARLKQWLGLVRLAYPPTTALFAALRAETAAAAVGARLADAAWWRGLAEACA